MNSDLALVDSGLQLNLEIALSGVSAKVKPLPTACSARPRVRWDAGSRNQIFLRDSRYRVKLFFSIYDAIGQVTKTEAKELTDFAKSLRRAVIA